MTIICNVSQGKPSLYKQTNKKIIIKKKSAKIYNFYLVKLEEMSVYSEMFCQYTTTEREDLRKITWTTNDCHLTWHDLWDPVTLWIIREFHVVCYRFLLSPGQYSVTIVREDFYFLLVRLWLGGNIDAFISWNDSHIALLTSLSPKMRGAKIKINT